MSWNIHPFLEHGFPKRLEALEAVASGAPGRIDAAAVALAAAGDTLGTAPAGVAYKTYAKLAEAVAQLARWKSAIRAAEVDADRYLRSARAIAKEAVGLAPGGDAGEAYRTIAVSIEGLTAADGVADIFKALARLSLPLPLLARPEREPAMRIPESKPTKEPPKPEVFLEFMIDGQPFASPQIVSPGQLHDISVNVVVRNWPASADRLMIHPISVEEDGVCMIPEFILSRPKTGGPHKLEGRLSVMARQSIAARPLEYSYRADFLPTAGAVRPLVSGTARLEIRSYDPALNPVSGYQEVDRKLIEIRDTVKKRVIVDDRQLADFLVLMSALGRIAGKALQDADFKGKWDEAKFQKELLNALRADPRIGSGLEEHPRASGGITDLSFRQIRLELKEDDKALLDLKSALKFTEQTAQYVAGSDRRLGILCVLDSSPKMAASGLVSNDIGVEWVMPKGGDTPTTLGIVIVRGNLPRPSSL